MGEQTVGRQAGLYRPEFEHDNCGIGAVVNIKGRKSHETVANALKIVENLEHRAGKDAEGKTGDGVGILLQVSHKFFSKVCTPLGFSLPKERDYGVGMFFFPQDESGKKDFRSDCGKRRNEISWMAEGADLSGSIGKESGRMYALYYAGVYRASAEGGAGLTF